MSPLAFDLLAGIVYHAGPRSLFELSFEPYHHGHRCRSRSCYGSGGGHWPGDMLGRGPGAGAGTFAAFCSFQANHRCSTSDRLISASGMAAIDGALLGFLNGSLLLPLRLCGVTGRPPSPARLAPTTTSYATAAAVPGRRPTQPPACRWRTRSGRCPIRSAACPIAGRSRSTVCAKACRTAGATWANTVQRRPLLVRPGHQFVCHLADFRRHAPTLQPRRDRRGRLPLFPPLLRRLQPALQRRGRPPAHPIMGPLQKGQRALLLRLPGQVAPDIGPDVRLPDRPRVAERPPPGDLPPFCALPRLP